MIIPKAFSFLTISCLFLISCSFLERFDSHFDDYSLSNRISIMEGWVVTQESPEGCI